MLTLLEAIFFFQYLYIVIIGGLYIIEVIVICQRRNRSTFSTPFYTLFVIGAFLDLNFELLASFIHRVPMSPVMNGGFASYSPSSYMTIIFGVAYYLPAAQEYLNAFIALNRLTAIVLNTHHGKIWHYLTPLSIVIILTAPFLSVWYLFFCPIIAIPVVENNNTLYLVVAETSSFPQISVPLRTAILVIGGATSCLVLYSFTAIWMRCVPVIQKMEVDRRLFYFGCTLFVLNIPCAALQLHLFFLGSTLDNLLFAYKCLPWLVDIKSLLPPILLFVFNQSIRTKCLEMIGLRKRRLNNRNSIGLTKTLTGASRL